MKKVTSLLLSILSAGIFYWLSSYTAKWPFDYHVSEFVWYLFYWSFALFIVSLFALMLDYRKYKVWLIISLVVSIVSLLLATAVGDGNGAIIDFDGELITWFFVGLYSIISIIYFIVQFITKSKSKIST